MKHIIDNSLSINDVIKNCNEHDIIYLKSGIYNEKIEILKDNITIIGEGNTIIANNDYYHKIMDDYNECNTFRTYTIYVGGNNVTIENITIKNTSVPSSIYGQAVALHVDGSNFKCLNCTLESEQDTLCTGPLPSDLLIRYKNFLPKSHLISIPSKQLYKNCIIKGNVDFIFGTSMALFYECDIISLENKGSTGVDGYISAPAHPKESLFGYLFYKCNLKCEGNVNNVFFARPWRDYGTVAFIECNVGDHINPLGYNKWDNTNRDKTARFYEYSINCDVSKREPWAKMLNKQDSMEYVNKFIETLNIKPF